jgi:hypothetical protein
MVSAYETAAKAWETAEAALSQAGRVGTEISQAL